MTVGEEMQRKTRRMLIVAAILAVFAIPASVHALGGFEDVPDTNVFKADIQWLADNGVTKGCNPPDNTKFCPEDAVTRGQMAAFMHRLADKVVEAKTALSALQADHATTADSATTADDSGKLEGLDGSSYTNPIYGTACHLGDCPDAAGITRNVVLELSVDAPTAGVLQISASGLATQPAAPNFTQSWVTLDASGANPCGDWFFGPLSPMPGTYTLMWHDAGFTSQSHASSTTVEVAAGAHTLRLCTLGTDELTMSSGGLNAVFSSFGSATVVGASSSFSPDDYAPVKEFLGDGVKQLNG